MGTYLDIVKVIEDSQGIIQYPEDDHFEFVTLSEEFLYKIIVNGEELSKYLQIEEIEMIRPNWGEINLKSTNSLLPEKREIYLGLLKEVMRTNSDKLLNEFLVSEGIISFELKDLKRDPEKVMGIVEKIEENIQFSKYEKQTVNKFQNDFKQFKDFLNRRINANEYILMEYSD